MRRWLTLGALAACGGTEIQVSPTEIAWGEVDFNLPRPDAGYDARNLEITNLGATEVDVVLRDVDDERMNVQGRLDGTDPPSLTIGPEATAVLTIGVWGYQPGEWDTEVDGTFVVSSDDVDIDVAWSYTPIRVIEE